MSGKLKKWNVDDLADAVAKSTNYSQVCRALGLSHISSNFRTIKKYIQLQNLDVSHFNDSAIVAARRRNAARIKLSNDEVFRENSPYHNTVVRRKYVKMVEAICAICGNRGEHMGKPLRLEMDHINGINNDNRLENLRLLCPNCHSQTETFGYKG